MFSVVICHLRCEWKLTESNITFVFMCSSQDGLPKVHTPLDALKKVPHSVVVVSSWRPNLTLLCAFYVSLSVL